MNKKSLILLVFLLFFVGGVFFLMTKNQEEAENGELREEMDFRIEIMEEGVGSGVQEGETVTVHYVGMLENGKLFDTSLDRDRPFTFVLGEGQVIEGWEKGVLGMREKEKRRIFIPAHMGYGERGAGVIPPNANLIFEVELLEIN
jgi:FKBP-type peptidyl-prolyl cis-trans isomerase